VTVARTSTVGAGGDATVRVAAVEVVVRRSSPPPDDRLAVVVGATVVEVDVVVVVGTVAGDGSPASLSAATSPG
jgi:hypothetical protein